MATTEGEKIKTDRGKNSLRGADDAEARRQAARVMGAARTEAKRKASRRNGALAPPGPGRTPKPLSEIACRCDAGDALEGHKWSCPRGQAIKRRQKAGTL